MDEAFLTFQAMIEGMTSFRGELIDETQGVRSHIYQCEIEMPVELDVTRAPSGELRIGSTPPLYYVDTSVRPSYHRLKLTAEISKEADGD